VAITAGFYEKILLEKIKNDDQSSFSIVFTTYYRDLVMFSLTFTKTIEVSEEIVQDTFVKFWEDRHSLVISSSLKSYFLKAVQNRSIDWIRHLKIRDKYADSILHNAVLCENDTEHYVLRSELELNIDVALKKMPVELAETFQMSRFKGLTYSEISTKLNISVRTVEVRIGKALHFLRDQLKDYLLTLLVLWFFCQ